MPAPKCTSWKKNKHTNKTNLDRPYLWVCLKENQPAITPTKQFPAEKCGSAVIQGFNTNRNGESVVVNGLSLEYPLYESSLTSIRISV